MKETLKKVFHKSVLAVVGVVFGIGIVFQYVVFPGLTVADTYTNILAALIGIFSILFVFHYIQWKELFSFLSENNDEVVPPGETEYDYIPQEEIIKKKKTVNKKVSKPLVEGKTKSQTKKGKETTKATPPPKPPKLK